jgi:sec-independent protein translocase protein TatC
MSTVTDSDVAQGLTLGEHLRELRSRLVRASLGVLLATGAVWNFYPSIFAVIRRPFEDIHASHPTAVLALTGITSGFSLQLRVSLAAGFALSSPIWLFQLWRFIAPGLHKHERKWAYIYSAIAAPLFLGGIALAYYVMPQMLNVLYAFTPNDVSNVTSVDSYLTFFLQLTLFFGLGFLLPIVFVMLNAVGILSGKRLVESWRWIILGAFVFGAVATPSGDPLGMTVIAIPMILLMMVAVAVALLNDNRRARKSARTGTDQWADDEVSPLD